ncbi:MAG: AAA family ATPase [Clostridiales bacterium]|nr:AAA family ATPase [Clostridiales bacterium]
MMDYAARYGLEFNPFIRNTKDILLETAESTEVKTRLGTLEKTQGFGILTGEPGRGKTTCARIWANTLNPSRYKVCYTSLSSLTVMEFYRQTAMLLGADPRYRKSDLFEDIQREIRRCALEKRVTPVIIIDEADKLTHKVLSDLQIMFNFDMDSRDLAMVLLVGQPRLNMTLNQNTHESLRQRIVMNYHMGGISKEEGRRYITGKLEGAGCRQDVFDDNAVEAILNAANGTPRMINKICNRSIMIGASFNQNIITAETVGKAVEDIQLG